MLPKITIVGRLVADPELAYLPSQVAVAKFTLACSEKYKDRENTCFLPCVCFGKTGESLNKYFVKGKPILASGKLKTDQWKTNEGHNRSKQCMLVEGWAFVPKDNTQQEPRKETENVVDIRNEYENDGENKPDNFTDDIPF